MAEAKSDIGKYYFTSHHLVRDFLGGAATFTFFLAGLAFVDWNAWQWFEKHILDELRSVDSWSIDVFAVIMYVLLGYLSGVIVDGVGVGFRHLLKTRWAQKASRVLPKQLQTRGYWSYYKDNKDQIIAVYSEWISCSDLAEEEASTESGSHRPSSYSGASRLSAWAVPEEEPEPTLGEMIDRLMHYFRNYDPDGYGAVYRTYHFLSIYRQAAVYTATLLAICALSIIEPANASLAFGSLVTILLFLFLGILSGTRTSVNSEFTFIATNIAHLSKNRGKAPCKDLEGRAKQ